jgi:hypothetical protein
MRSIAIIVASCTLVTFAGTATAQKPAGARRVSATLGLSKGAGALRCSFCTGEGKGGLAGMIGVETGFRRGVSLGVEANWWVHSGGGSTRSLLAVLPVMHFHTAPSSPLFLKTGLGVGRFSASSDEEELHTTAVSGLLGAGYEVRLSNAKVLVPYVSWMYGGAGTMRLNGARVTSLGGLSLFQYGLALSTR